MYKTALRGAPRCSLPFRTVNQKAVSRRLLSTAPPAKKSRSWKSSAVRWGIAIGGIYYYNTSNVFAEEPEAAIQRLDESLHRVQESNQPTIDAIVEEKRLRAAQRLAEEKKKENAAKVALAGEEEPPAGDQGLGGLEEEADQQGAFNPETGEINWDCPCLGGMAHGPCGEEFRAAFSCFVYSNEEPKGVECIEKFKGMQDCFRQHPEVYASEFEDDEDEVEDELRERDVASSREQSSDAPSEPQDAPKSSLKKASESPDTKAVEPLHLEEPQKPAASGIPGEDAVPREAFDATSK